MGCDASKDGNRSDIPCLGAAHDFEARPVKDKIVIYDCNQNKWFEIDQDVHIKPIKKEEMTSEHWVNWMKPGEARMHGPLGLEYDNLGKVGKDEYDFIKPEDPIVTLILGKACFAAIDEEPAGMLEVWKDWVFGEAYEQMTWACVRDIVVKTQKGVHKAEIKMTITGTARCSKTHHWFDSEHSDRHAKFHSCAYEVKVDGKPYKIEGEELTPNRYHGKFGILPDGNNQRVDVSGATIETRMKGGQHEVLVRTSDQCSPLGGLGVGVAMGAWMHPGVVEKHAKHYAYDYIKKKFGF